MGHRVPPRGYGSVVTLVLMALLIAVVAFTAAAQAPKEAQTYKWNFVWTVGLIDNPVTQNLKRFADLVKTKTDGRLTVTVRPAGELPYKVPDYPRAVGQGDIEMADVAVTYVTGSVSYAVIPTLPFLVQSTDEMVTAMKVLEPYIRREFNKLGIELLYWHVWPQQQLWGSGKPVQNLADLKGRKIRLNSREIGDFLSKVGAVPITIEPKEVASALQRRVVEGAVTSAMTVVPFKWDEFLNWGYIANLGLAVNVVIVNRELFERLPANIRTAIREAASEIQPRHLKEVEAAEAGFIAQLRKKDGFTISYGTKEDQRRAVQLMKGTWAEWAKQRGSDVAEALSQTLQALGR